jgi:hypothetical protein
MVFGDVGSTKRWTNDPRIEVHGPGYSKVVIGPDAADSWESHIDTMAESIAKQRRPVVCERVGRMGHQARRRDCGGTGRAPGGGDAATRRRPPGGAGTLADAATAHARLGHDRIRTCAPADGAEGRPARDYSVSVEAAIAS